MLFKNTGSGCLKTIYHIDGSRHRHAPDSDSYDGIITIEFAGDGASGISVGGMEAALHNQGLTIVKSDIGSPVHEKPELYLFYRGTLKQATAAVTAVESPRLAYEGKLEKVHHQPDFIPPESSGRGRE